MSSTRGTAVAPTLMAVVAALLAAAHFSRADQWALSALSLAAPLLLALPGRWPVRLLQVLLLGAAAEWVRTAARLAAGRMAAGEPWLRLAAILAAVAAVTLVAAWLQGRTARRRAEDAPGAEGVAVATFAIAAVTLGAAHSVVRPPCCSRSVSSPAPAGWRSRRWPSTPRGWRGAWPPAITGRSAAAGCGGCSPRCSSSNWRWGWRAWGTSS